MKRLLTITFALLISVLANAQIQTKFWGVNISGCYSPLEEARTLISERCKYAQIEDTQIIAMNGTLGGYNWKLVTFSFFKTFSYYTLYDVRFTNNYKTYEEAKELYDSLLSSLINKYGEPCISKEEDGAIHYWADENSTNRCFIHFHEGISRGGESFWYVDLDYWDMTLLERAAQQEKDEL